MRLRQFLVLMLVLSSAFSAKAQIDEKEDIFLKGLVLDSEKNPVKGGDIYVDSVKTSIETNKKGRFKILLDPDTKYISAFSWMSGIHTIEYNGETELTITFPGDNELVDEAKLLAMGFAVKSKTKLGKTKRRQKDYSKYQDVYQMIVAEVPGAQATGRTISLRGSAKNSVNFEAPPIFIVDDTQVSSIDFIRPNEIATLEVIRDEGTSLYGSRGAGGVIKITLKK